MDGNGNVDVFLEVDMLQINMDDIAGDGVMLDFMMKALTFFFLSPSARSTTTFLHKPEGD